MSDSIHVTFSTDLALQAAGLGTWQLTSPTQTLYVSSFAQQVLGLPLESTLETFIKQIQPSHQEQVSQVFQTLSPGSTIDLTFQIHEHSDSWVRLWGSVSREAEKIIARGVVQVVAEPAPNEFFQEELSLFSGPDHSPIALALLDEKNLSFLKVNARFAELKANRSEQWLGKSFVEMLPELEGLDYQKRLREILSTGTVLQDSEVEIKRGADQPSVYVDLFYQPQWNESHNRYTHVLIIATDVTLRVQMRKELEAQKAQLEYVIQSAPVSIARLTGPEFTLATANKAFIEIAGKGPQVLGKPLIDVMPEIDEQPFLTLLEEVYTKQETYEQKALPATIIEKGQVKQKFFDVCYVPLLDSSGRSYGVLCFSIDVTDQVRLRKRMEQSSQSLQNAVDLAQLGTWVMHIKDRIVTFSPAVSTWIGITSALTFEQVAALSPQSYLLKKAYLKAIKNKLTGKFEAEVEIKRAQGQRKLIFYALGNTQFNEKGQATQIRGFVREVTAERLMQQQLEAKVEDRTRELATTNENLQASNEELVQTNEYLSRSNESLEQFAFIASHDLQEPLRKIRQFSDLLVKHYQRERVLREEYLDRIRHSADRMSELVSDLLAFSQISNAAPVLREVDLNEVLGRYRKPYRFRWRRVTRK